jgi:DNA-binding GntR family transcriptional regulator
MSSFATATPLETTSLSDQAAARLRDEILAGRIAPGERLNLDEYKARWGVSITPLRDAAKRLEADGLVTIIPRRGVFVATIDKEALFEIFEIRIALEPLVAELAAPLVPASDVERALGEHEAAGRIAKEARRTKRLEEIDQLIHDLVRQYCPNARLARILTGLRDSIIWCQNTVRRSVPQAFEPSLKEHIAILRALRAGDGALARDAMRNHLIATRDRTAKVLRDVNQFSSGDKK